MYFAMVDSSLVLLVLAGNILQLLLLVCAWEDQRENQCYICHKISSILYGKYSTVILILVCNQCSKQPPLLSLPAYVYS